MQSGGRPRERLLYAFRGWIAFVAFMDLGTAFRSYIERRSFLGDHSDTQFIEGEYLKERYCWNPTSWLFSQVTTPYHALSECTACSRLSLWSTAPSTYTTDRKWCPKGSEYLIIIKLFSYKRVVSMGGCSLALTMVFYATEALYFRSSTINFYVIFPCVLNCK